MRIAYPRLCSVAVFSALTVLSFLLLQKQPAVLTVAFLDVGQGDALYIESPTGTQVLLDGGPDNRVLKQLSAVMPFFDTSLDMVIESHPDKDHIAGLPEVLRRYTVGMFVEPGTHSDSAFEKELEARVQAEGVVPTRPTSGDMFDLGEGATLEILFPDRPIPDAETNLSSLVALLRYGGTSFLLTGDSPLAIERYLLSQGTVPDIDVLKVGHHGSKTSSSELFLKTASPEIAIISAGKDNRYGHPHQEVLERLTKASTTIYMTAQEGTIVLKSDGTRVWRKE